MIQRKTTYCKKPFTLCDQGIPVQQPKGWTSCHLCSTNFSPPSILWSGGIAPAAVPGISIYCAGMLPARNALLRHIRSLR